MIRIAYTDRYVLDLPQDHKFPMSKYELVKEQLLYEGLITEAHLYDPGLCDEEIVLLTHEKGYFERFKNLQLTDREVRKIGFPLSNKLVKRCLSSVSGTVQSATNALTNGIGMNIAGGTHHAYADRGEGFCCLNDIAIASNYLLHTSQAGQILVIDLDVHQGNGTAKIFENKPEVFTFSMHGADNYPLHKEQSDIDIPLPYQCTDEQYIQQLQVQLPKLIDKVKPDFVFYLAGVDVLATDNLGKLALTKEGCKTRDEMVISTCKLKGLPIAVSMGGGYSKKISDIVDAHCNTFRIAFKYFD